MGLSSFPCPSEGGVLPALLMNTVMSVAYVASKLRSFLRVTADQDSDDEHSRDSRVSITRYGSPRRYDGPPAAECCVCLCRFEAGEEVSELSCKHVFHRSCLDKWFDNRRTTCPLCRSVICLSVTR